MAVECHLSVLVAPPALVIVTRSATTRALNSSISRTNVSTFRGTRWVVSVVQ
jgi:hypothetical protein